MGAAEMVQCLLAQDTLAEGKSLVPHVCTLSLLYIFIYERERVQTWGNQGGINPETSSLLPPILNSGK